ncbi:hypothetical protein ASE40_09015 [Flavobacterium sp. Root935]|nr:hypothetical protein ASE40_09015 [Flavobacterium sp. Root935]
MQNLRKTKGLVILDFSWLKNCRHFHNLLEIKTFAKDFDSKKVYDFASIVVKRNLPEKSSFTFFLKTLLSNLRLLFI